MSKPWEDELNQLLDDMEREGIFEEPPAPDVEDLAPKYPRPDWLEDPAIVDSEVDTPPGLVATQPRRWEQEKVVPRPPGSFVISGPLPHGNGPGRRFINSAHAERWAREHYGEGFHAMLHEPNYGGRWAAVVSTAASRAAAQETNEQS